MATTWQLPYFNLKLIAAMTAAAGGEGHATLGMTVTVDSDDPELLALIEQAAALRGVVLERLEPAA